MNEKKLRSLNLEFLIMKRKDKYQEHPIEEKALQIFKTNLNRKNNILTRLRGAYIVTNSEETRKIHQVKFMIEKLREIASQWEICQYLQGKGEFNKED